MKTSRSTSRSTRPARLLAAAIVVPGLLAGSVLAASSADAATTTTAKPAKPAKTGALSQARAACTAGELTAAKSYVDAAITHRTTALARLTSGLAKASHVTSAHRDALSALYTADTTGLKQLDGQVQADPTCAAVRTDAQHVVRDYYVFALVVPQSGLTAAADSGLAGADALKAAEPAVKAAIALMPSGSAKTQAQAAYTDLVSQVGTAVTDFTGVGDAVLALTPATFPTHTGVLKTQSGRVVSGGQALGAATADAEQIAQLLG